MHFSQKYCLAAFLQPVGTDTAFAMTDWPPHVTLADVFAIDRTGTGIDRKLRALLDREPAVRITASEAALLGATAVTLLEKNEHIVALHARLIDLLAANSAVFNTPEFTRTGFLPHCTSQKSGRLHPGDTVWIDTITLVDMFPDGDWRRRKTLKTFALRGSVLAERS